MNLLNLPLKSGWKKLLTEEMNKPYFEKIGHNLQTIKDKEEIILPPHDLIFEAFNRTPLNKIKIIILGQDPYHKVGQAMGLSFSVPKGVTTPPSLRNIYKEMNTDVGSDIPTHGDLKKWADQGVLLLNAILTVSQGQAGSHRKIGWQAFTDRVIELLSAEKEHLVFMLWGNFAKEKSNLIDASKHLILKAAHPSPLARGAYFGSKHFSQANAYLTEHNIDPIDWSIE